MIYEQQSEHERVERVAPVGLRLLHLARHLLLLPAQLAEALLSSSRLDSATCAFSSASSFSFCLVDRKLSMTRLVFLWRLPIGTVITASMFPVRELIA